MMEESSLLEYYCSFLQGDSFDFSRKEFGETKKPRYIRCYKERLISQVKKSHGFVPTAIPDFIEGCAVLMVAPSIRDAYICSAMVGQKGQVIAIIPDEQDVLKAKSFLNEQMNAFDFSKPNIEFRVGVGEYTKLDDESVDVAIVNALFNAAPDQKYLLNELFRVLKPSGELYLSSIFIDNRRLSALAKTEPILKNNLIGGAMYVSDFRRVLLSIGINTFRYMEKRRVKLKPLRKRCSDPVRKELAKTQASFRLIRTFKLDTLEDDCENYKLVLTYKGTAPGCEQFFDLDDLHRLFTEEPLEVCGNTFAFVAETRFAQYFKCKGDRKIHYGIYDYCEYCGGQGDKIKKPLSSKKKDCNTCKEQDCRECDK